jgi:ribosomal-protein-alanine N-acetyltransferase
MRQNMDRTEIAIYLSKDKKTFKGCAKLMAGSEPWKTLKREFEECLAAFFGIHKEVYVVTENNTIIGFAILQMAGTFTGYIQSILVTESCRGRGIGTQLIRFCEDRILQVSPNIFMCVSSFNTDAARLYKRLGYETVGELRNFVINGHSEILLRKTIGPINKYHLNEN